MLLSSREQLIAMLWNVWMGAGRQLENVRMCRKMSSKCLCSFEAERERARESERERASSPHVLRTYHSVEGPGHCLHAPQPSQLGWSDALVCCAKQDRKSCGLCNISFLHLLEYMVQKCPFLCVMAGKKFAVGFYLVTMQASLYVCTLEACSFTFI